MAVQVHPTIDGKCKTWMDKRTKCLVFSFCGVENGNVGEAREMSEFVEELRYNQKILKPEGINLPASPPACHLAGIQDAPCLVQQNNLAASQSQPKVSFPNNIH